MLKLKQKRIESFFIHVKLVEFRIEWIVWADWSQIIYENRMWGVELAFGLLIEAVW